MKLLIARHESFRTAFITVDEIPKQRIHDAAEFEIEYYKLGDGQWTGVNRNEPLASAEARGLASLLNDFIRPFDLPQAPLARSGLIELADGNYLWLVDMHHIISDATTSMILSEDFMCLEKGRELAPLRLQYKDYSEWQMGEKEKDSLKQQGEYWRNQFKGEIPVITLPTDFERTTVQSTEGARLGFEIDAQLTTKIRGLLHREAGITLYMLLLAVYTVLLSIYSGQEDIVVGSPIAGRNHEDLQKILGMFVNMLPMRNYPRRTRIFREFLREVQENSIQAFANQDYQFDDLIVMLNLPPNPGRYPLVDTFFTLQNAMDIKNDDAEPRKTGQKNNPEEYEIYATKSDLSLDAVEWKNSIYMWLTYSTRLFKGTTVEKIKLHYMDILEQVVENPGIRLENIKISHGLISSQSKFIREEPGDFGF